MSVVEACDISKLCVDVFKKLRADCSFDQFSEPSKVTQANLKVNNPVNTNVPDVMKVVQNLTILLMPSSITREFIFRLLIQPL